MSRKTLQVAGDVCIDVLGVPQPRLSAAANPGKENWRLTGEIRAHYRRGGALLLTKMIGDAAQGCQVEGPQLMTPGALCGGRNDVPLDEKDYTRLTRDEIVHSVIRVEAFRTSAKEGEKKTLRVGLTQGFSGPAVGAPTITVLPPESVMPDIVVLDDTGNNFRNSPKQWPAAVESPDAASPPFIVHKLHHPLPQPDDTYPLWKALESKHPERRVVVVSVDDLRDDDIPISRGLSWERTALDLVWHLMNLPRWRPLRQTPHLIVRLSLDGALDWKWSDGGVKARLVYSPAGIEGSWEHEFDKMGRMVAYGSAFTAGLTGKLAGQNAPDFLESICAGLAASRRLLQLGFGPEGGPPEYPGKSLFEARDDKMYFACQEIPIIPEAAVPDRGYWRLIDSIFAGRTAALHDAVESVSKGDKPSAHPLLKQVPLAEFAGLKTYDRREIESYRALYSLMRDYVNRPSAPRPLSVAVFGPPGAGKSFGVKMVAKTLGGGGAREIETLTFNLSQYRNADELAATFHLVRDVVLRAKIPLVFFDEFDTALDGEPLGWLRYLLSPMQDAEFIDRGAPHPIGQAIFVFAGGTCSTYEEFARPFIQKGNPQAYQRFKDAKGPDFLSRLRGTLDIPGLDLDSEFDAYGPTEAFPCEAAILLRRANSLAYQLREKAPTMEDRGKTLQIGRPVIRALMHLPRFAHGNRSFEALLDMSHLVGEPRFTPSLLPATSHASLHADAAQLMRLLATDYPYPPGEREAIAQAVHLAYLSDRGYTGTADPNDRSMREWKNLDDDLKESNRQQADHIALKLRVVGLWFRKRISGVSFSPGLQQYFESNVDRLARMEHDRWVAEKRRAGWIQAPDMHRKSRRNDLLLHNFIFQWEELTEEIKNLDRTAARRIPEFLAAGEYEIYAPPDNDASFLWF